MMLLQLLSSYQGLVFFHTNVNHHKKMRKMAQKKMAVRFFADFNVPLTNDYPASRVDHFDLSLKSWERGSDASNIFKVLWFTVHSTFWMSQTSFMLDKSVLPVHACVLYSNPHSITKQMAATSISRSDFEQIIDSMFSKLWQSPSPVFRKNRRSTPIWDGFCFGFNHVLSRFYLRERIHDPVSVSRWAFNSVLLWNWRILNKNV